LVLWARPTRIALSAISVREYPCRQLVTAGDDDDDEDETRVSNNSSAGIDIARRLP
jgi:hypothetical protein